MSRLRTMSFEKNVADEKDPEDANRMEHVQTQLESIKLMEPRIGIGQIKIDVF